jgi:hypothetical protein
VFDVMKGTGKPPDSQSHRSPLPDDRPAVLAAASDLFERRCISATREENDVHFDESKLTCLRAVVCNDD